MIGTKAIKSGNNIIITHWLHVTKLSCILWMQNSRVSLNRLKQCDTSSLLQVIILHILLSLLMWSKVHRWQKEMQTVMLFITWSRLLMRCWTSHCTLTGNYCLQSKLYSYVATYLGCSGWVAKLLCIKPVISYHNFF